MAANGLIVFKGANTDGIFYGNIPVDAVYYGNVLIWKLISLLMGTDKFVCIEFTPDHDMVSSSANPISISVFMNTSVFTDTHPPMWIFDAAGVTCGYSTNGIVSGQETIDGCTGYKRTNTFRDNQLFLQEGKIYYICYKVSAYDTNDYYFAYYDKSGNYKLWNPNGGHTNIQNLLDKNYIGSLTSFVDLIDASNNDLFVWDGITKCGVTQGYEYVRNNDSLSDYVPVLNYGNTDKFEVLNHILMMDKGSGQYGGAGDKFVITETYNNGPIGLISRTSNYTSHVFIPPSAGFFHRTADAYKYIFDTSVNLTEGKAVVWGNNYVYTYGSCYVRGSQYAGYSCYESRTGSYINTFADLSNVNSNELFYLDSTLASKLNDSEGLKVFGNVSFDVAIESPSALEKDSPKVFAAIAAQWNQNKSVVLLMGQVWWPFGSKHTYQKTGNWNNMITSTTPLTTEPSNPQTNDVYYKAANVTWGSISDECLVKYNGTGWETIYPYQYSSYESDTDVSQSLYSAANTNGILNEFQASQLYQEENVSTLLTRVEGDSQLAAATLYTDKTHYLEIVEG